MSATLQAASERPVALMCKCALVPTLWHGLPAGRIHASERAHNQMEVAPIVECYGARTDTFNGTLKSSAKAIVSQTSEFFVFGFVLLKIVYTSKSFLQRFL